MLEVYREAFTEVNEILKCFSKDLLNKVPKEFIDNIRENMSTSYIVVYDNTKGINEQNLKQETRAILSVIYRDYICNENDRNEIIKRDRKECADFEEKKKKEYGDVEIFKIYDRVQNTNENKVLKVIEKQNIITKIIEKIKTIWRKIRG